MKKTEVSITDLTKLDNCKNTYSQTIPIVPTPTLRTIFFVNMVSKKENVDYFKNREEVPTTVTEIDLQTLDQSLTGGDKKFKTAIIITNTSEPKHCGGQNFGYLSN